ncbi:MAG: hypothetical protein ABSA41_00160 [Terriglobia bacterium]
MKLQDSACDLHRKLVASRDIWKITRWLYDNSSVLLWLVKTIELVADIERWTCSDIPQLHATFPWGENHSADSTVDFEYGLIIIARCGCHREAWLLECLNLFLGGFSESVCFTGVPDQEHQNQQLDEKVR